MSDLGCFLKETHDNSALHEMNFSNQNKILGGGMVCGGGKEPEAHSVVQAGQNSLYI